MSINSSTGSMMSYRSNLTTKCEGVVPLTNSAAVVLTPPTSPATGAPRWVVGGTIINYDDASSHTVTVYYVEDSDSPSNDNIIRKVIVPADDAVLIGDFPLVAGFKIYAVADANSACNIFLPFEQED